MGRDRVIWKYLIRPSPDFTLDMPEGLPEFLAVQMQDGVACMWASVDPNSRSVPHKFRVVQTGAEYDPGGLTYIGTFQPTPDLVFHLFSVR